MNKADRERLTELEHKREAAAELEAKERREEEAHTRARKLKRARELAAWRQDDASSDA